MAHTNRNDSRETRGEPRRYESEEERRMDGRREESTRGITRISMERADRRNSERENDLYERQSI